MSTSASPVMFGYDFQSNAAIVLMLENMREMKTIRVEGKEDIEIQLNDGSFVLAQAKAVVDCSTDFSHVRENAKKAISTLAKASEGLTIHELILITNSPNPLNDELSRPLFYGRARKKYDDLPPSAKSVISDLLLKIDKPLDTSKFIIQVLPFESDDDKQRYRAVIDEISDYIGEIDILADGLRKKLQDVWSSLLTKNGTRKDENLKLQKKDVVWPIIVYITNKGQLNREAQYCNQLDESEYNEICRKYEEAIDYYSERYDFVTKIVTDYSKSGLVGREAIVSFVNEHWVDYKDEIKEPGMDETIQCNLLKIILFNILVKRIDIDKIKRAVNL